MAPPARPVQESCRHAASAARATGTASHQGGRTVGEAHELNYPIARGSPGRRPARGRVALPVRQPGPRRIRSLAFAFMPYATPSIDPTRSCTLLLLNCPALTEAPSEDPRKETPRCL